jgi:hypothetical protein
MMMNILMQIFYLKLRRKQNKFHCPQLLLMLAIACLLFLSCTHHPYVLPSPDGDESEPSSPSLQGRIVQFEESLLTVSIDGILSNEKENLVIKILPRTEIFTLHGGYVPQDKLQIGQRVRIWFEKPSMPKRGEKPIAAVVMLASKDPNGNWPLGK